jgi:RHS repeat-associated protein
VDTAAGTFTGTYDVEGKLTTEGYPNGMNVNHIYGGDGEEIGLEYVKTTNCSSNCTWYSDSVVPSIAGQWFTQTSTLSSQNYTYDSLGRLTKVQDTPSGQGCTTHVYAYDTETNRTSLTNRSPGVGGACATEGGTAENHGYDTANRLTDTGIAYDTFGNTTKVPAADAGGSEVTNTYYVDDTLASQIQKGETIGYYLDPAGRTRETVSSGNTNSTIISHYSSEGNSPAWTVDIAAKWTRNIEGIGGLAAIQVNGETPVLQIANLHGDIVGTASLSETASSLLSTEDTSEYGVPRTSSPPKYSWLGSDRVATELPSGIIAMGARSYIPQLGRFLQTDPVAGGSANAYAYTNGDPVNTSDPSGEMTYGGSQEDEEANTSEAKAVVAVAAALEAAAQAEAEAKAKASTGGGGGVDPNCKLKARLSMKNGYVYGLGSVTCDKPLPAHSMLTVCLQDPFVGQICAKRGSGWDPNHPKAIGVWKLRKHLSAHPRMECLGGEEYEAVAWLNVPGVKQWRVHTKREECDDLSGELIDFTLKFVEPEPPE